MLLEFKMQYADYHGISYKGQNTVRRRILDKAKQMTTITWICPEDFVTWQTKAGTYSIVQALDGTTASKFVKGKIYAGIPYSMMGCGYDDISWLYALKECKITTESMKKSYHGRTETTAKGIDCSRFISFAYRAAFPDINVNLKTKDMIHSDLYRKITISELLPGDILLRDGHTMMYVGNTKGKFYVFEADASDSKCCYNEYSVSYSSPNDQMVKMNGPSRPKKWLTYTCYRLKLLDS